MKQKRNLLVTLADRNYIAQAKQLFSSVYHNAGWQGDYMLLAHQIPEKELKWFRDKGILVYKCKPLKKKQFCKMHPSLLDKFYLFKPYFKKWDNIIYLDADIIVRASLDELTNIKSFGAVVEPSNHNLANNLLYIRRRKYLIKNKPWMSKKFSHIESVYNMQEKTFNAGMFAFSTDLIKRATFGKLINIKRYCDGLSSFGDQLIFNLYFYKKWIHLPRIYNRYFNFRKVDYNIKSDNLNGIIIHGAHKPKPWDKSSPLYNEWFKNLILAEQINLYNPWSNKIVWSSFKIILYNIEIETRGYLVKAKERIVKTRAHIRNIFLKALFKTDRKIGKVGLWVKGMSPWLYKKIRIKR